MSSTTTTDATRLICSPIAAPRPFTEYVPQPSCLLSTMSAPFVKTTTLWTLSTEVYGTCRVEIDLIFGYPDQSSLLVISMALRKIIECVTTCHRRGEDGRRNNCRERRKDNHRGREQEMAYYQRCLCKKTGPMRDNNPLCRYRKCFRGSAMAKVGIVHRACHFGAVCNLAIGMDVARRTIS